MRHRTMWASAAGFAGALGVLGLVGTAAESRPPTAEERAKSDAEMRANSPRRTKPAPPIVMGVFRNGEAQVIKLRSETTEIDTPSGKVEERNTVSSEEEVLAQLPPEDPRFIGVAPTPKQIEEIKAKTNAEQARVNSGG